MPGGHLVLTDEGNLWYTTNIRQFPAPPEPEGDSEADGELPAHPPLRRAGGKSSIVELAGGVGKIPGFDKRAAGPVEGEAGLKVLAKLAGAEASASSEDVISSASCLGPMDVVAASSSKTAVLQAGEPLAAAYLREGRCSMSECLDVLESDRFRKTRKQRARLGKEISLPLCILLWMLIKGARGRGRQQLRLDTRP